MSANVSVNWDVVFSDRRASQLLSAFVEGERGYRATTRTFKSATARTELYRLERSGVATAKRRIKRELSNRTR